MVLKVESKEAKHKLLDIEMPAAPTRREVKTPTEPQKLKVVNKRGPWLKKINHLYLPVAHQEGKFIADKN